MIRQIEEGALKIDPELWKEVKIEAIMQGMKGKSKISQNSSIGKLLFIREPVSAIAVFERMST